MEEYNMIFKNLYLYMIGEATDLGDLVLLNTNLSFYLNDYFIRVE